VLVALCAGTLPGLKPSFQTHSCVHTGKLCLGAQYLEAFDWTALQVMYDAGWIGANVKMFSGEG
jgi:hypothetical protein